jgi:glycosyltransferase involved in cell wall biosynthesis
MERNTVLIFTYFWPPASAGGVWRFLKMSKYLLDFGWQPITVTVEDGAWTGYDETLLAEVSDEIEVHHTKSLDPYTIYNKLQGKEGKMLPEAMGGVIGSRSLFQRMSMFIRANMFIPDPKRGWVPYAVSKGKALIKDRDIKAIITTGPPNSVHLIGNRLRKQFDIPWVMDMRDPWTSNYMVKELIPRLSIVDKWDERLESSALAKTDCLTGISPGLLSEFKGKTKRIELIYNGFDPEDFPTYTPAPTAYLEMSYIGSLKPNMDIKTLWKAIEELNTEVAGFAEEFKLRFMGNLNATIIASIHACNISDDQLLLSGFGPHEEAIHLMQSTSLLLFIVPRATYAKSITSGKVFEYLAARSPMLSIGPVDGDAAAILNQAGRASMIDYDDKEGIKASLLKSYTDWKQHGKMLEKHQGDAHMDFSRKRLTERLAGILDELILAS